VVRVSDLGSKGHGFNPRAVPTVNACLYIFTTTKLCLVLYYVFDVVSICTIVNLWH